MKKKYFIVTLKIVCGEYEFSSRHLAAISTRRNQWRYALDYAKNFYGNGRKSDGGETYYFNGGEVAVSVRGVVQVTAEEAAILGKFL